MGGRRLLAVLVLLAPFVEVRLVRDMPLPPALLRLAWPSGGERLLRALRMRLLLRELTFPRLDILPRPPARDLLRLPDRRLRLPLPFFFFELLRCFSLLAFFFLSWSFLRLSRQKRPTAARAQRRRRRRMTTTMMMAAERDLA